MQVGDLVVHYDDPNSVGVVVQINDEVEIPSLINIFWPDTLTSSRVYADEIQVVVQVAE